MSSGILGKLSEYVNNFKFSNRIAEQMEQTIVVEISVLENVTETRYSIQYIEQNVDVIKGMAKDISVSTQTQADAIKEITEIINKS